MDILLYMTMLIYEEYTLIVIANCHGTRQIHI